MNTQVSYFKKALVVLMAVMMVFTMMPSMAWADGGDSGTAETPKSCLAFTTDLVEDEEILPYVENNMTIKLNVEVTKYYDADGNLQNLPEATRVSYKWYMNDAWYGNGPTYNYNLKEFAGQKVEFYAKASATIDGETYEAQSKTHIVKVAPKPIEVNLTVNNKGTFAETKDGNPAANLSVSVADLNGDNQFSLDEALTAAHQTYLAEENAYSKDAAGKVTKLWNVDTTNTSFYVNDRAVTDGVTACNLTANDNIYASVNTEVGNMQDVYCHFDAVKKDVLPGDAITLTLTDSSGVALSDISIGTWTNGSFQELSGVKTDADGKVTLSFSAAGTYYVTAKGNATDGGTLMAPLCVVNCNLPSGNCGNEGAPNVTWSFDPTTKTLTLRGFADTVYGSKRFNYPMPWSQYSSQVEHVKIEMYRPNPNIPQDIGITLNATFYDCPNLQSVSFQKELKGITAAQAFSGCSKLTEITFDSECNFSLGSLVFENCAALKEVTLPENVTVSQAAFSGCSSLKKVTLTKAGPYAFAGCSALEEVIYRDGATSFGNSAFGAYTYGGAKHEACTSLKTVSIPRTLTQWGTSPFTAEALAKVKFVGDGVSNFYFDENESGEGYKAIYNGAKTELYYIDPAAEGTIVIPNTLTSLGDNAFAGCSKITKVEFEAGSQLTQIPTGCFKDCSALQAIDLPDSLQGIGNSAFSGCVALENIELPNSLKEIGGKAFAGCSALQSISLPEGLQSIGANTFANCNKIKTLKLPTTLISLGAQAVEGTSIEEIVLPPSIKQLKENQFYYCTSLKRIEIQGEITSIPKGAFVGCSALESIFLPKTVSSMETGSFSNDHFVVYFAGTTTQWRNMDADGLKCKAGVICNYRASTAESGNLDVKPSKLVYTDVEEMTKNNVSVTLQYPNGAAPAAGDQITADWYYTTGALDGLKRLRPLAGSDYSLDASGVTSSLSLKEQAATKQFGTWNYVCVVFKTTADGKSTMFVSEPIAVTLRDASFTLAGTGSEKDPYQIKTYEDLQRVAERVESGENFEGIYFALENDITVSKDWTQIGTVDDIEEGTQFAGIFDGKNHIVTYERGAKCLFRSVGGTTIKNVQVQGEYIASAGLVDYIGPIVFGGRDGNILNCKLLNGSTTLKSGLVGSSGGVNITNCEVESNVKVGWDADDNQPTTFDRIGSIIGSGAFNLVSCKSAADVTSKGNQVGGLAGYKSYAMRACTIKNSQFTGSIHADDEYVGGILGAGYDDQTAPNTLCAVIENCYVNADITGAQAVGGIFGGEGGCDQCWDNGIGYIRNNVFYGALHINGKEIPPQSASSGPCAPADNIGGSKGAVSGFMRSLNKNNVIENNYYFITNGEKEKGIGAVEHIDTSKIRPMGTHDGVYYYDTSKDSLKDICNWVDSEDGINRAYSSVTSSNKNRDDDPLGADKDNLAKACTQKEMTDGSIVKLLNANANSMHNWVQGENCPVLSDKAVAYKIEVGGDYRKEYYIGDKLDLSGIQFTVTWSDGTTTNPTLENGVTVTGFDSSKQAIVHLTAAYENATCDFTVKINKRADGTPTNPNTIKVNLTLLGDSLHGENGESHTLKNGGLTEWLPSKDYEVDLNATVWDFLQEVEKKATNPSVKFNAENSQYGMYISSVTYNSTTELAQMDNGPSSGWMYTLNGKHPLLAVSEQFLKDGDKIVFHYTDDYTVEQGSEDWNTPGGGVVEEVKNVTTDTKAGTTTAPTEVKVSEKTNADGTKTKVADVKVSADNQKEILKQAKEKKSNEIILVVSGKEVGDAAKADVTLDKSFIDSIVKDTNAKLTIKTPFGDKTYTQDGLKAMSEAATGSTVTVAIEKAAEEPADDAAAKMEKAKSIVKDMKLVARSSKTAKKNIKAVLKSDAKVNASIKELKDLGFTVKYRFYRSTKKASSYKSTVTKKVASYTNTSGKKGTKYFYKVQVRVYDENGKLIAKTALKQCKYATRTWTKAK